MVVKKLFQNLRFSFKSYNTFIISQMFSLSKNKVKSIQKPLKNFSKINYLEVL